MSITDSIPSAIQATLSFLSLLFVSSGFLLYRYQGKLIYPANFPPGSRTEIPTPDQFGMREWEEIDLKARDGTKLMAFFVKKAVEDGSDSTKQSEENEETEESTLRNRFNTTTPSSDTTKPLSKTTLFYFHANAGNLGHRLPIAKVLHQVLHCNVFLLSYRGYGRSEGEPSEDGIRMDAEAGLEYLLNREDIKGTRIVLYGQSIGGAVAVDIASRFEEFVDALIVENTFLSLPKLIPSVMPLLSPFKFLCHQTWHSETRIANIRRIPMLLLSGARDELVPVDHMIRLCKVARKARKEFNKKDAENEDNDDVKEEDWKQFVMGLDSDADADSGDEGENSGNGEGTDRQRSMLKSQYDVTFALFKNGTHNDTCVQPGYFAEIVNWWTSVQAKKTLKGKL